VIARDPEGVALDTPEDELMADGVRDGLAGAGNRRSPLASSPPVIARPPAPGKAPLPGRGDAKRPADRIGERSMA
jgi:hypothetical protein